MAIDFYSLPDISRRQKLFSLSHQEFDLLGDIWEQFRKATGVNVDAYGSTRIYPDHVELIKKLLLQQSIKQDISSKLLTELNKVGSGFLVDGD